MLQITNNLDRTDEAAISNWPFTYESTLDTGDGKLTADSFLAISVNVDETTSLPCRFKGVSSDGRLIVCDAGGTEICSGQLFDKTTSDDICSFFLYNQYGILCGFVSCKKDIPQQLFALSKYTNDMHYFGASAFVFLPQCHVQSAQGNVRSFGINGQYTTSDLHIKCSQPVTGSTVALHNVIPETNGTAGFSFGVYNVDQEPPRNGWCRVIVVSGGTAVGTYNVEDKHIIIKAACASNLRVVDADAAIILRGVQDAQ